MRSTLQLLGKYSSRQSRWKPTSKVCARTPVLGELLSQCISRSTLRARTSLINRSCAHLLAYSPTDSLTQSLTTHSLARTRASLPTLGRPKLRCFLHNPCFPTPLALQHGPTGYYKGKGGRREGRHTRKGNYIVRESQKMNLQVPDLTDFALNPYVVHSAPKVASRGFATFVHSAPKVATRGFATFCRSQPDESVQLGPFPSRVMTPVSRGVLVSPQAVGSLQK